MASRFAPLPAPPHLVAAVEEMLDRAGHPIAQPTVIVSTRKPRDGGSVRIRRGGDQVILGDLAVEHPCWRWLLAHELGHLVARDLCRKNQRRLVAMLMPVFILLSWAAVELVQGQIKSVYWLSCAAAFVQTAALALQASDRRRWEVAADAWALSVGEPVTDDVVEWLSTTEPQGGLHTWALTRWVRTHPLPHERRDAQGALAGSDADRGREPPDSQITTCR